MIAQVISFNCLLKDMLGKTISFTYNKDVLTAVDDEKAMLLGLAKGLQDIKKGEKRIISLSAEEAYGFYDPKKVVLYPRSRLPKNIQKGTTISIIGKSGQSRAYNIIELHDNLVSLDGNHPLAGQDLVFEIEALEVRHATHDDIGKSLDTVDTRILH
jgi:FKBP-type peptidyl-prolyl cis-trans isomerase SlyD